MISIILDSSKLRVLYYRVVFTMNIKLYLRPSYRVLCVNIKRRARQCCQLDFFSIQPGVIRKEAKKERKSNDFCIKKGARLSEKGFAEKIS